MLLPHLVNDLTSLLIREEGEIDFGQIIWSIGIVILGGIVAILGGSYVSPEWREFVGRPLP